MAKPTEIVPAAVVDVAINIEAVGAELDGLLGQIRKGEAAIETAGKIMTDWRYRAGVLLAQVRKQFPKAGRNAKGWGEFVAARGISLDSAVRYIEIAEQVKQRPELAQGGAGFMDLYRTLGIAAEPPSRDLPQAAGNVPAVPKQDAKPKVPGKPPVAPAEAPKSTPKPTVRTTYDRGADGAGDDSQAAPDDGLPVVKIEPPASVPEQAPAKPFVPALFGEGGKAAPDADDEFNPAKEQDRARALFRGLFLEWPKRHWPKLCEAFDDAQTEAQS